MRVLFVLEKGKITAHYDDEAGLDKRATVAEIPPDVFDCRPLQVYEKAFELGRQYQQKLQEEAELRKIDEVRKRQEEALEFEEEREHRLQAEGYSD